MSVDLLASEAAVAAILADQKVLSADTVEYGLKPGTRALRRALLTSAPLAAADLLAVVLSVAVATGIVRTSGVPIEGEVLPLLFALGGSLLATYFLFGLYPGAGLNPIVELRQTLSGALLVFTVFFAATRLQSAYVPQTARLLMWACPLALISIPLGRAATRLVCARFDWWGQRVLVFGGQRAGLAVYHHLRTSPWLGLRPVGIVDDLPAGEKVREERFFRGSPAAATGIAEREGVTWAIVAMPERRREAVLRMVERHVRGFPHLLVVPDMAGLPSLWTSAHECGGMPGLRVNEGLLQPLPRAVKRCTDVALILLAAPLLLPVMSLVALAIKISAPGPVFYCQQRIGLNGRRFYAWKFRSMVVNADRVLQTYLASNPVYQAEWDQDHKLRNDPRITRVGHFIRKSSLDELPQLWNVLRGEMSLVGPRPIVEAEISKYTDRFALYAKVTPGITGMWQVSGRNDTTYEQRVELDAFYARNWSPWLDLFILARTVKVVLFRNGAY